MSAWVGLGGNRGDTGALVHSALSLLNEGGEISRLHASRLYRSSPWGVTSQPDFTNAVVEFETKLGPGALLDFLLHIEKKLGRERNGQRWGPRVIDLDLLTYEDLILKSEVLELPHPRMHLRAFVLVPILELDPDFVIPGVGKAEKCLARLARREVESVVPLADSTQEAFP
jgi:2-amino-4-hydroxy-6-hydroxymethyldihydropteridine diphosphokinase